MTIGHWGLVKYFIIDLTRVCSKFILFEILRIRFLRLKSVEVLQMIEV